MFEMLGRAGISYQIVLSKVDRLYKKDELLNRTFRDIRQLIGSKKGGASDLGEILCTTAKKTPKSGLSKLRWSVLAACGING